MEKNDRFYSLFVKKLTVNFISFNIERKKLAVSRKMANILTVGRKAITSLRPPKACLSAYYFH